jgi:hypothetical protein
MMKKAMMTKTTMKTMTKTTKMTARNAEEATPKMAQVWYAFFHLIFWNFYLSYTPTPLSMMMTMTMVKTMTVKMNVKAMAMALKVEGRREEGSHEVGKGNHALFYFFLSNHYPNDSNMPLHCCFS